MQVSGGENDRIIRIVSLGVSWPSIGPTDTYGAIFSFQRPPGTPCACQLVDLLLRIALACQWSIIRRKAKAMSGFQTLVRVTWQSMNDTCLRFMRERESCKNNGNNSKIWKNNIKASFPTPASRNFPLLSFWVPSSGQFLGAMLGLGQDFPWKRSS